MKKYDVAVIGSGPGGYVAAIRAAQLGLKTCCIEKRKTLGGVCLNVGCIPSKALLHSSHLFHQLSTQGREQGIMFDNLSLNWTQMLQRKDQIVKGFTQGIEGLFKKNKVDWISGAGCLKSVSELEVNGERIEAQSIVLATGSFPVELPFLPFDETQILSSTGALSLTSPPKKLLVIGAGVIGLELGSVYQRVGSEVVFIEFSDRVCPGFDRSLSTGLEKILRSQGMKFHFSHKVIRGQRKEKNIELQVEGSSDQKTFEGDAVLIAVGRKPYVENLGLEAVGIAKDSRGFIQVDGSFRTSKPSIFAIGDLIEGPMLAHKASEEGMAVAEIIAGNVPIVDYFSIPNVIYTNPEVASAGFTEEDLKAKGIVYHVKQFPFKANSRARCVGEEEGFVKILCEATNHRLLGIHILGAHASEMISEGVLALSKRMTVHELAHACHPHPTLSEAIQEAALSLRTGFFLHL